MKKRTNRKASAACGPLEPFDVVVRFCRRDARGRRRVTRALTFEAVQAFQMAVHDGQYRANFHGPMLTGAADSPSPFR